MDRFKSKVSKLGNKNMINVPMAIKEYFPLGIEVEVFKIDKYKYGIWDKKNKGFVINPETNKPYLFQYPIQAENYIYKHLGDSTNFDVLDMDKSRKVKK